MLGIRCRGEEGEVIQGGAGKMMDEVYILKMCLLA